MRLVVDSSIWVKAFNPTEMDHSKARTFVDAVLRGDHDLLLPYSVLTELVCRTANRFRHFAGNPDLAVRYGELVLRSPNIKWRVIDREFAYHSAYFGRTFGFRGMDALVAFTALDSDYALLTSDKRFDKMAEKVGPVQPARSTSGEPSLVIRHGSALDFQYEGQRLRVLGLKNIHERTS